MKRQLVLRMAVMASVLWAGQSLLWAQQAPDTILYNGKIVTVDNHEINADVGTIAEAVAIQDGKIVAVGSNAEIRRMAGGSTQSRDLKGRTVLPGFAATHDHPMDWDQLNPYIVKKVVTDDMHIERFLNEAPEQNLQKFPRVLEEAVRAAKPGQWIRISLLHGREYRGMRENTGFLGRQITKQMLDLAAPDNPVLVRAGFVGMVVNQKAFELTNQWYEENGGDNMPHWGPLGPEVEQNGLGSVSFRGVEQDVLYPNDVLREIYRLGTSWWAGYGVTLNASAIYTAAALNAYNTLDRNGEIVIRIPWTWLGSNGTDHFADPYFRATMNLMQGIGSDHLWMGGVWPAGIGTDCTTLPGTTPEVKAREPECSFGPGTAARQALYNLVKSGGRFTGMHTGGDKDIDYVLEIIQQASKDAGMTLEEIRAKRHAYDHMAINPRPDQVPILANLGMQTGGWDFYIWEGRGQEVLRDYGEEAAQWVVPRKSLLDGGVRSSVEIDRPLGYTDLTFFTVLYAGISRKDQNGAITSPQQGVSREAMLKSATLWGAYYAMREDQLGSLEPGKWADLVVLDKDYMTVPEDDILNLRVLMTMVGGKVVHLVPSLARELGMQAAGAQVELGGPAAQW